MVTIFKNYYSIYFIRIKRFFAGYLANFCAGYPANFFYGYRIYGRKGVGGGQPAVPDDPS